MVVTENPSSHYPFPHSPLAIVRLFLISMSLGNVSGSLQFYTNVKVVFSISVKDAIGILVEIHGFGYYGHFNKITSSDL